MQRRGVNYKKHKDVTGLGDKRRAGTHEDCPYGCGFVSDAPSVSEPELNGIQKTLQLLPAFDTTTVHEHLRGEFHRRAQVSQ